jgi:hypothetical protein
MLLSREAARPDAATLARGRLTWPTSVRPVPLLYFLSITVLRSGRKRNLEYADFT